MNKKLLPSEMKLCLTQRDFELFQFLFENRLATALQIMNYIFKTDRLRYPQYRLAKLRRYGYIKRALHDSIPGSIYYFLTQKGFQHIFPNCSVVTCPNLKSANPRHDYFLLEITQKLKQAKSIQNLYTESELNLDHNKWQTEEILGKDRSILPDRLLTLHVHPKTIYGTLELEMTDKGSKRYSELIEKYYRKNKLSFVIYLFPKGSPIGNKVRSKEKEIIGNRIPKFFYMDYQSFLKGNLPLAIQNIHEKSFQLF